MTSAAGSATGSAMTPPTGSATGSAMTSAAGSATATTTGSETGSAMGFATGSATVSATGSATGSEAGSAVTSAAATGPAAVTAAAWAGICACGCSSASESGSRLGLPIRPQMSHPTRIPSKNAAAIMNIDWPMNQPTALTSAACPRAPLFPPRAESIAHPVQIGDGRLSHTRHTEQPDKPTSFPLRG